MNFCKLAFSLSALILKNQIIYRFVNGSEFRSYCFKGNPVSLLLSLNMLIQLNSVHFLWPQRSCLLIRPTIDKIFIDLNRHSCFQDIWLPEWFGWPPSLSNEMSFSLHFYVSEQKIQKASVNILVSLINLPVALMLTLLTNPASGYTGSNLSTSNVLWFILYLWFHGAFQVLAHSFSQQQSRKTSCDYFCFKEK